MPAFVAAATPYLNTLPTQSVVSTTVPGNGDINPYGVAVVPRSVGMLVKGDVLVSNFNAKSNLQGTGTTIVQISPAGSLKLFATVMPSDAPKCTGGIGLTTGLVVLRDGWVVVGSLPTKDGMSATAKAGCLIVLNSAGKVAETFQGNGINGPWDMTALDNGSSAWLFVSNVLNGTVAANGKTVHGGTVLRIGLMVSTSKKPVMVSHRVIGWGFAETTDPSALVIGPTGLGLAGNGDLYVADTLDNRIAVIKAATMRMTSSHRGMTVTMNGSLMQPLGLAMAPNGDILTMNAGDGNIVETTRGGHQVVTRLLDSIGAGTLFGLAVDRSHGLYFVDDGSNDLQLLH
jgi:hypothetical protein